SLRPLEAALVEAARVLADVEPGAVRAVEVDRGGRRVRLERVDRVVELRVAGRVGDGRVGDPRASRVTRVRHQELAALVLRAVDVERVGDEAEAVGLEDDDRLAVANP